MTNWRRRPPKIEAQKWDWADGEQPPELPGLSYRRRVAGRKGTVPDIDSAVIRSGAGFPIRRGDWWVRDDGKVTVLTEAEFNARYEAAP